MTVGTIAVTAADGIWRVALLTWGAIGLANVLAWGIERDRQWDRALRVAYGVGVVVVLGAFVVVFIQNAST